MKPKLILFLTILLTSTSITGCGQQPVESDHLPETFIIELNGQKFKFNNKKEALEKIGDWKEKFKKGQFSLEQRIESEEYEPKMPLLRPDTSIDYKIRIYKPDTTVDYKIRTQPIPQTENGEVGDNTLETLEWIENEIKKQIDKDEK